MTDLPEWMQSLQKVAAQIQNYFVSDRFTQGISPDYLARWTRAYPMAQGKRIRPALVYWCCGLLGGDVTRANHAAVAVELYHNWTLVHDDIIDSDDFRRGQPTVHKGVYNEKIQEGYSVSDSLMLGQSTGILAGDILQGWAVRELLKLREDGVPESTILSLLERMEDFVCRGLISGEAIDVDMSVQNSMQISCVSVLKMMMGKTGVLLGYACEAGARIARPELTTDSEEIQKILDFANHLGIAFQLRDDWLGLLGSEETLGKPIGSDLINRKPTLFYIKTLERLQGTDKEDFYRLTGRKDLTADELKKATRMMSECGVIADVVKEMKDHAEYAIKILKTFPESRYRDYLCALTEYAVLRNK